MSSFILKWVANRFLKDNQFTRFGVEDPYYEEVVIGQTTDGKPKYKKVKRKIPQGISENDLTILTAVKKQAFRYDMWFTILGVRFGLSNVVGIVPFVGAFITNYWSLALYWKARGLDDGLPLDIQLIMLFNIVVDVLLSLIPVVGDLIEVGYKANLRNFLLLEKHLVRVGKKNMGLITEDEVRPGFLNDKVQPFVDESIKPGAVQAGQQLKKFVETNFKSSPSKSSSVPSSAATTQSSNATAIGTLDTNTDEDARSIRSFAEMKEVKG